MNLKRISRKLEELKKKRQWDGWSDGMVIVGLLAIVTNLVDYLEQKEQKEGE